MNSLLLNVICAFAIANTSPNAERAQQTLDALYKNYARSEERRVHLILVCCAKIILLTRTTKQLIWRQKNKQKDIMNILIFGRTRVHSLQ